MGAESGEMVTSCVAKTPRLVPVVGANVGARNRFRELASHQSHCVWSKQSLSDDPSDDDAD